MKFSVYGKVYTIVAVFPHTLQGIDAANSYTCYTVEATGVLITFEGEILMARIDDHGAGTPSPEPNPHWVEREFTVRFEMTVNASDPKAAAVHVGRHMKDHLDYLALTVYPKVTPISMTYPVALGDAPEVPDESPT